MEASSSAKRFFPSPDPVLFALLVGVYIPMRFFIPLPQRIPIHGGLTALVVLALGGYWLLDLLAGQDGPASRRVWSGKWALVVFAITVNTLLPGGMAILARALTAPYRFVHDGLIQSEAAVRFVLAGRNPYAEDYRNTPMGEWPFELGGLTVNPALDHYPYMPMTFLLPLPVQALSEALWGWFDQRLLYLLLFAVTLALSGTIATRPPMRLMLLMALGLNPLSFLVEGRNDVLILFWLVLTIHLMHRGRWSGSAVTLALACATKQLAWFFVPFYWVHVWAHAAGDGPLTRRLGRIGIPLALFSAVFGAAVLPWFLWSPAEFLGDILAFQSGLSANGYPIAGIGFGAVLLGFGLVGSNGASFPFWIFQAAVGLPLMGALLRKQWRDGRLATAVTHFAVLMLTIMFFSRAFNDNYLGFISSVMALALFMDRPEESSGQPARLLDV